MKYQSQRVAYWFFASALLLLSLQIVYGFIMGFARIGMDGLHEWIPFNTARATHKNLLVGWLLCGFMGSAYFIIPEEADRELWSVKLAYAQLLSLLVVGGHRDYLLSSQHLGGAEIPRNPKAARLSRRGERAHVYL